MRSHSRPEVRNVTKRLSELVVEPAAIVLIGSVARNCATQRSDVDVLVVGEREPLFKLRSPDFEFHVFSETRFLRDLKSGDDFPNWCTRFGVPLSGKKYWESILYKAEHSNWPDWKKKITVASRRLLASRLSLRNGDKEAAAECALFAYDHFIRGVLLREAIFPLSRPELVKQIRMLAPELGRCLFTLLHYPGRSLDFRHIFGVLSGALKDIDPELHGEFNERLRKLLAGIHTHSNAVTASGHASATK